MLSPARVNVWRATKAAFKTARASTSSAGGRGVGDTQLVRGEIIAQALVEGSAAQAIGDPIATGLVATAKGLLNTKGSVSKARLSAAAEDIQTTLLQVLFATSEEAALERLSALTRWIASGELQE